MSTTTNGAWCHACGRPLGRHATLDRNGHSYHPTCAPGPPVPVVAAPCPECAALRARAEQAERRAAAAEAALLGLQRSLSAGLNSGDGSYRP